MVYDEEEDYDDEAEGRERERETTTPPPAKKATFPDQNTNGSVFFFLSDKTKRNANFRGKSLYSNDKHY